MWYEDLTKCDYLGEDYSKSPIAIGWLESDKSYSKGKVSKEIIKKICEFSKTDKMCVQFRGYHRCDFCNAINTELGAKTILIAHKNKVYICPALIIHYIETHFYLPPNEFIEAVLNYDHKFAMEYFKEIGENRFSKIK